MDETPAGADARGSGRRRQSPVATATETPREDDGPRSTRRGPSDSIPNLVRRRTLAGASKLLPRLRLDHFSEEPCTCPVRVAVPTAHPGSPVCGTAMRSGTCSTSAATISRWRGLDSAWLTPIPRHPDLRGIDGRWRRRWPKR